MGKIKILPQMTSDPHIMNFKVDRAVIEGGAQKFSTPEEANENPLAALLLDVPSVILVDLSEDNATTTLAEGYTFEEIIPKVQLAIEEHFDEEPARY